MASARIPASADLSMAMSEIGDCHHLGPNTLKAIAATIQDLRRRTKGSDRADPSPMLIHYGDHIIAGIAPPSSDQGLDGAAGVSGGVVARRGSGAGSGPGAGAAVHMEALPTRRLWARLADAAQANAAGRRAQRRLLAPSTRSCAITLQKLKTSLAEGKPFAFLFMEDQLAPPTCRSMSEFSESGPDNHYVQAHAATAIGYDDAQQAFMVVKQSNDIDQDPSETIFLSYAYVTHPVLSQDVWTIWKPKSRTFRASTFG